MPRKNPSKSSPDNETKRPAPLDKEMLKNRNPDLKLPPLILENKKEPPSELVDLNDQHEKHLNHQRELAKRLLATTASPHFLEAPINQRNLTPSGQARSRGAVPADARVAKPSKELEQQQKRQPELTKVMHRSQSATLFNEAPKGSKSPSATKHGPTKAFPINKRDLTPAAQARSRGAVPADAVVAKPSVESQKQKAKHPTLEKVKSKSPSRKAAPRTPMPSPRGNASRPATAKSSSVESGTLDTSKLERKRSKTPPGTPRLFVEKEAKSPRAAKQAPKKEKEKKMRSRSPGFRLRDND